MIALDTQILVFAHRRDHRWYAVASAKLSKLAESGAPWAIPMHCLVEMYAKVTKEKFFDPPSTPSEALGQIDIWLESPSLAILTESLQSWSVTRDLISAAQIKGDQAYDARIAAVCLQHGVTELWTDDRDFLRFPALRVRNPLIDIQPTHAGERRATYGVPRRRPRAAGAKTPRPA